MNDDRRILIVEAIQQEMQARGFTQKKMANYIGDISAGHLNFVLNQKWEHISDQLWLRLEAMFVRHDWVVYETVNFREIQRMCHDSQRSSTTNCVSDYTGAGKTTALEEYSRRNPAAYYVLCDQMMSAKDLAREMQSAIGISQEGTSREMIMSVVKELKKMHRPLIIIDEADKLNDRCLLILKVVYDRLEGNCGFITAGTEVLRERIDKFAKRNKLGYREWKRRFGNYRTLRKFDTSDRLIRDEVLEICKDQGITDKSQIRTILANAENYGHLRGLIKDFQDLNSRAQQPQQLKAELVG